jgi:hypothetical protein
MFSTNMKEVSANNNTIFPYLQEGAAYQTGNKAETKSITQS